MPLAFVSKGWYEKDETPYPQQANAHLIAAALLGVTPQRVRALIKAGVLEAEKWGRDWQIDTESVEIRRKAMEQKRGSPKAPSSHFCPLYRVRLNSFTFDDVLYLSP